MDKTQIWIGVFVYSAIFFLICDAKRQGEKSLFMKYNVFNPNNVLSCKLKIVLLVLCVVVSVIKLISLFVEKR